jgi:integrase
MGKRAEDSALVDNIKRTFNNLLKKAHVPQCTPHDLHRSCITIPWNMI